MTSKIELRIEWDAKADAIRVSCVESNDCKNGVPVLDTKKWVEWVTEPEGLAWAVFFLDGSPFKNGKEVLSSGDPSAKLEKVSPEDGFKYWVALQHDGEVRIADPKIIVREGGLMADALIDEVEAQNDAIQEASLEIARAVVDLRSVLFREAGAG